MKPGSSIAPRVSLELRRICKEYRTPQGRLPVLADLSLRVRRGEFLCLLGPAGCGKSTLFQICAGLEEPDAGEVLVDGQPVTGPGADRGVVFADEALFPWLTVRENIEFGLRMQNVPPGERRDRSDEALELVRLRKFADASIHQLSAGMRQRVAIARAVVLRPKVLLLDEPFATLDAQTRNIMQEELQRIWAHHGSAVLFVTSNVSEALRLGDRVAVMSCRPGRIKREVPTQRPRPRLADDPHLLEIRAFLVRDLLGDAHLAVEEELGDA